MPQATRLLNRPAVCENPTSWFPHTVSFQPRRPLPSAFPFYSHTCLLSGTFFPGGVTWRLLPPNLPTFPEYHSLSFPPECHTPSFCVFPQEAGELYNRMLKRFRQEKAVWIKYGAFVLRRSQPGASHRVLQRALECLPTKERECSSQCLNTLRPDTCKWQVGSPELGELMLCLSDAGPQKTEEQKQLALILLSIGLRIGVSARLVCVFGFKPTVSFWGLSLILDLGPRAMNQTNPVPIA